VLPTSLAQPAIFTASLVSWFSGRGRFDALTGHSLGEYAALVAGEAISFEHGLCAVQVRAEVMNSIASRSTGGMVALLDLSIDECEEVALDAGVSVANDNCPGQMLAGAARSDSRLRDPSTRRPWIPRRTRYAMCSIT
jgi:malonyl CoA-acyl carrier protein transacylase